MKTIRFAEAVDAALAQAMAEDPRVIVFGEDIQGLRLELYVRFGPHRVRPTPISEAAFTGAAVAAAMGGLRPVVELTLIDFVTPAMDALLNQASKLETFSGGRWKAPLVIRAACGGGYGDAGQHEQSLWGWLAHIPGLAVVVPSTPSDAAGLMLSALAWDGPVIFLEHKLFGSRLFESLAVGGRDGMTFDMPAAGTHGAAQPVWQPVPIGQAVLRREGRDLTMASVGVGVHRCLEAAEILQERGLSAAVIDLRTVTPLDTELVRRETAATGRLLVVDEDYQAFGLSGELAAVVLEAGIPFHFARVCTRTNIPYARRLEDQTLPSVTQVVAAAAGLVAR